MLHGLTSHEGRMVGVREGSSLPMPNAPALRPISRYCGCCMGTCMQHPELIMGDISRPSTSLANLRNHDTFLPEPQQAV